MENMKGKINKKIINKKVKDNKKNKFKISK